MIGFACPWCDHQVSLSPHAFAQEAVVCGECSTTIDLAVSPVIGVAPTDAPVADLPLAA